MCDDFPMDPTTPPSEPDRTKRKLHWFQFGLRTLLIGVAMLGVPCAHVGSQARIARERSAWMRDHLGSTLIYHRSPTHIAAFGDPKFAPPLIRRWLGDPAVQWITVWSEAERTDAVRLFPEATIVVGN